MGRMTSPFDYTAVTPDSAREAVAAAEERATAIIETVVAVPAAEQTFANTVLPLDEVRATLALASGRYGFLSNVAPDDALRDEAHEIDRRIATYTTSIAFRDDLFAALTDYAAQPEIATLGPIERRYLDHVLRDFRRNGFAVGAAARARVQALKERLVTLGVDFRRNIDEADEALWLEREDLVGLPASYIERLQQRQFDDATGSGTRYRVSLAYPELYPFMDFAEREDLRRELFTLNQNKAAEVNLPLLEEAIATRDEIATTLGYVSWAHYAIETRMAQTPETAVEFLRDLEARVRAKADLDIAALTASKRTHTGDPDARLEIWDWRYYQQRVLRERYEVDSFAVAEYFPLDATLDGMFAVYQRLVGARFVEVPEPRAWHPDVRLFDVEDDAIGAHLGAFYLDLHPRPDKYGHAAAFTLRPGRELPDGTYETGISAMVTNFTKPGPGTPSLLRHSEVVTLFHEFGHILHQVMTRAPYARFAGTSVQRDFVEAPSQMLQHWVWDAEVLAGFTHHVTTGAPLPADLLARMIAAKHVASGLHYLRQLFFARLDLAYHGEGRTKDTDAIARELHAITGFPFVEGTHFQAGFGHLFGYDAGYYGYLWSQVYGDDMAARFAEGRAVEGGAGDEVVGRRYRETILEAGGTRDGADLLRDFLGREPGMEPFLREIGL